MQIGLDSNQFCSYNSLNNIMLNIEPSSLIRVDTSNFKAICIIHNVSTFLILSASYPLNILPF